ncbi:MAG: 3-deoxy-7-phosphoheptulonate synthase [Lachnospiraceae bacterium]|nr:3-deoxy-7-phosphoheptulonate synthase [Lachnospiraceae bacterium]
MIIIMKRNAAEESLKQVSSYVTGKGLEVHISHGKELTIVGVVGNKDLINPDHLTSMKDVERIVPVTESYKLANKKFHPEPTTIQVGNTVIGPDNLTIMAGPCAVESKGQLLSIAHAVRDAGATFLRGGAYKPRTSPYSFQGLETEGLQYMQEAAKETGLATICEVVSLEAIEAAAKYVDMIQIGARNMQNFMLLKEAGRSGMPVLLKRGLCATVEEWLNAAEYIIAEGNPKVVLCERGIRTFETATRNTLDLSVVPVLKTRTHLPIIIDPSHATGSYKYVPSMAKAAVACGADGLMIEVHDNPVCALSDGPQSLNFNKFATLTKELRPFSGLVGREF